LAMSWAPFFRTQMQVALALQDHQGWHLRYSLTVFTSWTIPDVPSPLSIETRSVRAFRRLIPLDQSSAPNIVEKALRDPATFRCDGWEACLKNEDSTQLRYELAHRTASQVPQPKIFPTLRVAVISATTPLFPSKMEL